MADALQVSVEMVVALAVIVGSFMYVNEALTRQGMIDVLFTVLVFGGGLIYLFSLVYGKSEK